MFCYNTVMKLREMPILNKEKRDQNHYLRRIGVIGASVLTALGIGFQLKSADSAQKQSSEVSITVKPGNTINGLVQEYNPGASPQTISAFVTKVQDEQVKYDEQIAKDEDHKLNPATINPATINPGEELNIPTIGTSENSSSSQGHITHSSK